MSHKSAGRPRDDHVRSYFDWDPQTGKSTCKIKQCGTIMTGNHHGNLEKHILRNHPAETLLLGMRKLESTRTTQDAPPPQRLRNLKRTSTTVAVNIDAKRLKEACCELVTVNGRPLSFIEDSGFRKIINPIIDALNSQTKEPAITLNRQNISTNITESAQELKTTIKKEVKNRLLCLKLDAATRLDRSLLGINIQYIVNGEIVMRNLAVKEMFDAHTAETLKSEIVEVLEEFNINLEQVYSCTTDNAANIVKSISCLGNLLKDASCECAHVNYAKLALHDSEGKNSEDDVFDLTDEMSSSNEADEVRSEASESDSETEGLKSMSSIDATGKVPYRCTECDLLKDSFDCLNIYGIRCGAHTLQLCVTDALKRNDEIINVISKARRMVKLLRTPLYARILNVAGHSKPSLDMPTRWNSLHEMLLSVLRLKSACKELVADSSGKKKNKTTISRFKNSMFNDDQWATVELICNALQPAKVATKIFQTAQLTVGNFYDSWLRCKLDTKCIEYSLAQDIAKCMEEREELLLSSPAISMGIFMDPRFRVLLSSERKAEAQEHLSKLWKRLQALSNNITSIQRSDSTSANSTCDEVQDDADDVVARLLREKEVEATENILDIEKVLHSYAGYPRINKSIDVLTYWEAMKESNNVLYKLAQVTEALPMTQVSVERTFSHLRQILSVLRYNLSSSKIRDILFLRCNSYFQEKK